MRSTLGAVCAAILLAAMLGCTGGAKSPAGFRLPDGDAVRGRHEFVALGCNACHKVSGVELPAAAPELPELVVLGGEVLYVRTDGELVTAIVNPSHSLVRGYAREVIAPGGRSRMKDYGDVLTVRQLIDLVAFLHSTYKTVPPPTGKS